MPPASARRSAAGRPRSHHRRTRPRPRRSRRRDARQCAGTSPGHLAAGCARPLTEMLRAPTPRSGLGLNQRVLRASRISGDAYDIWPGQQGRVDFRRPFLLPPTDRQKIAHANADATLALRCGAWSSASSRGRGSRFRRASASGRRRRAASAPAAPAPAGKLSSEQIDARRADRIGNQPTAARALLALAFGRWSDPAHVVVVVVVMMMMVVMHRSGHRSGGGGLCGGGWARLLARRRSRPGRW